MMTPDQIKKMLSSEHYFAMQGGDENTAKYLKRMMKAVYDAETTEECIDRIQHWPTEKYSTVRASLLDTITYVNLKQFLPIGSRLTFFEDHTAHGFTYYGALIPFFHEGTYLGIINVTKQVGYALGTTVFPFEKKGLEEKRYLFDYDSAYTVDMIIKNLSLLLYADSEAISPDWESI